MTADAPRLRVTTNLALGICLILFGTVLILDRMQLVDASQLRPVLACRPCHLRCGARRAILSARRRHTAGAPAGQLQPRPRDRLGDHRASVLSGVLAWRDRAHRLSETANVVAVMSRHQRISSASVFRAAEMTTIMGRADLDLRKTTVAPGEEGVIEVFTLMGGSTIRVPEGWHVDLRATPVMGGIRDRRDGHPRRCRSAAHRDSRLHHVGRSRYQVVRRHDGKHSYAHAD